MKEKILMGATMAAMAAGGAVLFRSNYERKHFVEDTFILHSPKIKKEHTLIFLSDLHNNLFGKDQTDLLEAIRRINPEAILIGGDMITVKGKIKQENAWTLLNTLSKEGFPMFYGDGNHENRLLRKQFQYGDAYDQLVTELTKLGITYLHNDSAEFGNDLRITGYDIARRFYCKFTPPPMPVSEINQKVSEASLDRFQILLAHTPYFQKSYAEWGADLTLSGHFHGGTIRLPKMGGVMTPQFQFFEPLCAGKHEIGQKTIIISRGLGTHSIDLRINNMSELVILRLLPEPKK